MYILTWWIICEFNTTNIWRELRGVLSFQLKDWRHGTAQHALTFHIRPFLFLPILSGLSTPQSVRGIMWSFLLLSLLHSVCDWRGQGSTVVCVGSTNAKNNKGRAGASRPLTVYADVWLRRQFLARDDWTHVSSCNIIRQYILYILYYIRGTFRPTLKTIKLVAVATQWVVGTETCVNVPLLSQPTLRLHILRMIFAHFLPCAPPFSIPQRPLGIQ